MKNRHDSDARTLGASVRVDWAQKSAGKRVAAISHKAQQADSALASLSVDKELGRSVFLEHTRPHRSWLLSLAEPLRLPGGACVHVPAVARDARIWLRGPNGAGKTSVLCALLAEANLAPGRILYLPQNLGQDDGARELAAVRGMPEELRSRVLSIVAALGVEPSRLLASHSPSPGEARKLMLARGMAQQCSILVLDEPENHLDLPSIERLQQALALYPGALLLVSHDEALARHVARSEWLLSDGALRVGELAS
jgi:ABC-type cobalamin/Fe3+-siderophores transport system ATPase subunit